MARITWLGEDDCAWHKVVFPPGVPVETTDSYLIGKARHNPFFRLDEEEALEVQYLNVSVREVQSVFGPAKPEMWTNDPEPDPPKRKRGRPPKVRDNVDQ